VWQKSGAKKHFFTKKCGKKVGQKNTFLQKSVAKKWGKNRVKK